MRRTRVPVLPMAAVLAAFILLLARAESAQAQPPPYFPVGPQVDVPVATLGEGWNLCYASNYNDEGDDIDDILAQCDGEYLLLAGKPVGSSVFDVLAAAPRADVTFDTGSVDLFTTHNANGTEWYFSDNWSWGFAPGGAPVDKNSCDIKNEFPDPGSEDGAFRLCWHTSGGDMEDGYRSGFDTNLQSGQTSHERFIYHTGDFVLPGDEDFTAPTAEVRFERKQGNGWVPYELGDWSRTIVRAILTCDDDGSGMMDLEKQQQRIFKQSMDDFVQVAEVFNPCEDRAGNVNDLSSLGDFHVRIDLQNPTCTADPSNQQVTANGEDHFVDVIAALSDNLDGDLEFSLKSLVSSDGGGSADLDFLHKDSDDEGHAGLILSRTKASLLRTYTATFEVEDDSGRTGTCLYKLKVK